MTQIADVLVLEPVAHILRQAAHLRLELPPKILPPGAALLYEAIDDTLIPYLKSKEAHRLPYRPGYPHGPMRQACRSAPSGARSTGHCLGVSTPVSHTRIVYLPHARCGVRMCTDLGRSPPTSEELHRMTDRRRTWGIPEDECR